MATNLSSACVCVCAFMYACVYVSIYGYFRVQDVRDMPTLGIHVAESVAVAAAARLRLPQYFVLISWLLFHA